MNHFRIYEAIGHGKYSTVCKGMMKESIEYCYCNVCATRGCLSGASFTTCSADGTIRIRWHEILSDTDELAEQCIQTNYFGTKRMTEALIPLLQLSDSPKIANVSSSMGKLKVQNSTATYIMKCDDDTFIRVDTTRNLLNSHLLQLEGVVKLADFGLSREIDIHLRSLTKQVGNIDNMAPEVFLGSDKYSTPSDIWAVGCVFALVRYSLQGGLDYFVEGHGVSRAVIILLVN